MPKFKPGDKVEAYFKGYVYWGIGKVVRTYRPDRIKETLYEIEWVTVNKPPHYSGSLSPNWTESELCRGAIQCLL